MCLPSTCFLVISSNARDMLVLRAIRAYGAGGDTIEALLALDGHVGAVGGLELDVKGGCVQRLVYHLLCFVPSVGAC